MTPAKRPSTRARQTPIQSLDDLQPGNGKEKRDLLAT